jgi:5-methylcytosine-specific restriction enzyme subunit McrC
MLFPMEYIFEDFIAGFLKMHFSKNWSVQFQKSDKYLSDEPKAFNMQHDILLVNKADPSMQIIVDTKYKIRDQSYKNLIKKGISEPDMYQMTSYAFKRACKEVFLIYPNISEEINEPDIFHINSGFNPKDIVKVTAIEVPFWSVNNFELLEANLIESLSKYF